MGVIEASDLIGCEVEYIGAITNRGTKFKVRNVYSSIETVAGRIHADVILVSENGKHYSCSKDKLIFKKE